MAMNKVNDNAPESTRTTTLGENAISIDERGVMYLNLSDDYFEKIDKYIVRTSWGFTSSGGTSWDSVTDVVVGFTRS